MCGYVYSEIKVADLIKVGFSFNADAFIMDNVCFIDTQLLKSAQK